MCAQAAATGAQGWGHPPEKRWGGVFPPDRPPSTPQVLKGKLHGAIDVRQSVMSVNKKAQRVDLDTEDNIYHLKVPLKAWSRDGTGLGTSGGDNLPLSPQIKTPELFSSWVSSLCTHHHGERPEPCPQGDTKVGDSLG